jgi:transposase-like protein
MNNERYWKTNLRAYRIKKAVRKLIDKFGLVRLADLLGVSKQYANNWSKDYLPKEDFLKKLKELEKSK